MLRYWMIVAAALAGRTFALAADAGDDEIASLLAEARAALDAIVKRARRDPR